MNMATVPVGNGNILVERRWMEGNMIETGIQLDEKLPLYEKVAGKISFLIEQGTLRPGDKVPSIRNLSKQMHVSINTVKEAYSLLEDRRQLEARPQSGYYVRARLPELPAEPVVDRPTINPAEVSLSKIYQEVMMDYNDQTLLQLADEQLNPTAR